MEQCENVFKDMLTRRKIQFTKVCAVSRVFIGMIYNTIHDVNDGFDGDASVCREYPPPHEDPNSRIYAMMKGKTTIGPVLQVHITRYLDIIGIEILILSTTGNNLKSWVVICRGTNRHVEESRLNDPDHNPASSELVNHKRLVAMKREHLSTKMEVSWGQLMRSS